MKKVSTFAVVLSAALGFAGPVALAQTTGTPNSGAGVPGQPGNKSGPAVKPGEHNPTVSGQDQSKVPGLPGNKSGPAPQKPPK
jgi:hypothetical protein